MNILLTGASGFVGSSLLEMMSQLPNFNVVSVHRKQFYPPVLGNCYVPSIDALTIWDSCLNDINVVIHCAARAHVMKEKHPNPLSLYRDINVDGTLNLANQAAKAGVKRFLFISSIKVNGERTKGGKFFTEIDAPAPEDFYAITKYEAERGLLQLGSETGMEVVIIRPSLVYGPGVKGNFLNMVNIVKSGIPLPLGAIKNKRSLIAIDNLVDLIITCIEHPAAANQIFLASDGEDLSTTDLLRKVAYSMNCPSRLFNIPSSFIILFAALVGKKKFVNRLINSLQVDISKARTLLGWKPVVTTEEALKRCFGPIEE